MVVAQEPDPTPAPLVAQAPTIEAVPLVAQGENASGTDNVLAFRATSGTEAKKRARATSGTKRVKSVKSARKQKADKPPTPPGHEWRSENYGWVLYRRTPIITEAGKRSSKRAYLAFYNHAAIERIYGTDYRKAATNA